MMLRQPTLAGGLLACLLCCGCSQNNSDQPPAEALAEHGYQPYESAAGAGGQNGNSALAPAESAADYGVTSARQSLKGISVVVPKGWEIIPPSGMRLAEYKLSVAAGSDGQLTVFYFGPNQGGSVEANIERWYGQFSQSDGGSTKERSRRWESVVAGMSVTHVDITGDFNGGMAPMARGGSAQTGYRMLGSIVMAPVGPYFFKLVGPVSTIEKWADSYQQYIDSISAEG